MGARQSPAARGSFVPRPPPNPRFRLGRWAPAILVWPGLFAASVASGSPIARLVPNQPPETRLTAGPADSTQATSYRVHFFWSGTDPDGSVDHFEYVLVDHPRSKDSIGPGGTDPVVITVPAPDDPRWARIFATDSTFVTLADTLRRDPRPGPGEDPENVRRQPFERWHTFFIRAVDDRGEPDPTPDYRSFNSTTIAPRLFLLPPVQPNQVCIGPPVIVFHWDGEDQVGDGTLREPVASRWVNITSPVTVNGTPQNGGYVSFPDSLYTLPNRYSWSDWHAWDAADGSGRSAVVKGLLRVGESPGSGYYIFAAQAMDEAGAITPVFDWKTPGKNNVALVRVSGASGPNLIVAEQSLGRFSFVHGSRPVQIDIAGGQPLEFSWAGDASAYGGRIVAYRYGWDLRDPDNDAEWEQNWCATCFTAPARSFTSDAHRFFLQVRDDVENITQAVFVLPVHPALRTHDVLFVDDSEFTTPEETAEDARWQAVLASVAAAGGLDFDPSRDTYDVRENHLLPPPMNLVLDYKVLVWNNVSGPTRSSALRYLCQFRSPCEREEAIHWISRYMNANLASGGRLWISGSEPAQQLWPSCHPLGPVNVTNWNDPVVPNPAGVDSVGTVSLLYKMGVEMFEVGGGLDAKDRSALEHYCQGLRAARPGAPELSVDPELWPLPLVQPGGLHGRPNIEIYDMPNALAGQTPPLVPRPGISAVAYTYISAPDVQEDPTVPRFYPQTADRQPAFILAKDSLGDPHFSRAFCGFEPYRLTIASHLELTRYVLREMGILPTPVLLQEFVTRLEDGVVRIRWRLANASDPAEFLLRASREADEWTVPHTSLDSREFTAIDDSPHLGGGGTVTYSLYFRNDGSAWALLGQQTLMLSAIPRLTQLLPPRPNPFNPRAVIPFVLGTSRRMRLGIYDLNGRRVAMLLDGVQPAGPGMVVWDGTDGDGRPAATGLYLVRMEAGGLSLEPRRLVLIR